MNSDYFTTNKWTLHCYLLVFTLQVTFGRDVFAVFSVSSFLAYVEWSIPKGKFRRKMRLNGLNHIFWKLRTNFRRYVKFLRVVFPFLIRLQIIKFIERFFSFFSVLYFSLSLEKVTIYLITRYAQGTKISRNRISCLFGYAWLRLYEKGIKVLFWFNKGSYTFYIWTIS